MTLFENLALVVDDVPRGGPGQMALDEALLESATCPTLRVYQWNGPAISFGCSQSFAAVRELHPSIPLVRRWTGGGIVEHRGDWTFSLIVPTDDALAALRPIETYRQIHEALQCALGQLGLVTRLVHADDCRTGAACFSAPALHDLYTSEGKKLCGGAQRRTRRGFLHQGSIQQTAVPEDFGRTVAETMASEVTTPMMDTFLAAQAEVICREKYATRAWAEKIP